MTAQDKRHDDTADLGPIGRQALDAAVPKTPTSVLSPHEMLAGADFDRQWQRFEDFARATFEEDLKRARVKAEEYGSHDLEIMGTSMGALLPHGGNLDSQSRHAAQIEMAIAFYLMGKAARMFGAFKKGSMPGEDSWRDGSIYSMMARYVRTSGGWIG